MKSWGSKFFGMMFIPAKVSPSALPVSSPKADSPLTAKTAHSAKRHVGHSADYVLPRKQMGWMAPAPGVAAPRWCCHAARAWSHHDGDHDRRHRPSQQRLPVHAVSRSGEVIVRRALRRAQVIPFFAKLPSCLIGMEACGTSHHWARELVALGHEVRLMPPAYVKPYVKRGKTDAGDAEAICEAVLVRPCASCRSSRLSSSGAGAAPDARSPRSAAHAARQHDPWASCRVRHRPPRGHHACPWVRATRGGR